jgi:hypothetical protein
MKLNKLAILAAIACGLQTAGYSNARANEIQQIVYSTACDSTSLDCATPSCDSGCDSGCVLGCDGIIGRLTDRFNCCDLGEPWQLFGSHCDWSAGGWTNIGYHSNDNAGLGILGAGGAPANFNNYADHVQLQQQWFFLQKAVDGSNGLSLGGRVDYIYGTDAPDTQSFGIADNHYDNPWDHGGAYGHAIPQLYGEAAYGDTSIKAGHFFTIVGNEVVQATGNFFYSRQFTFYNAEPFTHTGVLATHQLSDETTLYGGWVQGWDSGFKDNGDSFLGGIKRQLTEDVSLLYTTAVGRFNDDLNSNNALERGSVNSFILTTKLTDKLTNLLQYDYLDTEDETGATVRRTHGLNAYFIYQVSDCVALGSRTEYFNWTTGGGVPTPINNADLFNQTFGVNYKLNANLMIRPELRYIVDYDRTGVNENFAKVKNVFGMDAIFTF